MGAIEICMHNKYEERKRKVNEISDLVRKGDRKSLKKADRLQAEVAGGDAVDKLMFQAMTKAVGWVYK